MAYFSTGEEGLSYRQKWCDRCLNQEQESPIGCPVMDVHLYRNYSQCGDTQAAKATEAILGHLIPRTEDGNQQCSMFRPKDANA